METGKVNGSYGKSQKHIRRDMSDGDRDFEESFSVLTKTRCVAVLTENLFQDNKCDVAYLQSKEGFDVIVNIHVEAIVNWIFRFGN